MPGAADAPGSAGGSGGGPMIPGASHSLRCLARLRCEAPLALAALGVAVPERILWDGLPEAGPDPAPGDARAARTDPGEWLRGAAAKTPGEWLQRAADLWAAGHPARREAGIYLTDAVAARHLLKQAAEGGPLPRRILDPAAGAGVFLREAAWAFGPAAELHGVDRDPMAVALTRLTLWLEGTRAGTGDARDPEVLIARIRHGDSLLDAELWDGAGFDLVCGNPPFGNAIERRTARADGEKARLRALFPETTRGPFDRCVPFVQLAARLLTRRGRYALLLPRAILAARYGRALREWLEDHAPLAGVLDFGDGAPVRDAEIAMVGLIGERGDGEARGDGAATGRSVAVHGRPVAVHGTAGATGRPVAVHVTAGATGARAVPREALRPETWGALLDPHAGRLEEAARAHPCLRDFLDVRAAATVADSYAMAASVREDAPGESEPARLHGAGSSDEPRAWIFLTSGLLDRYAARWGERPARYLGRTRARPVLARDTPSVPAGRRRLYDSPKVVVAGLSARLEAALDPEGRCAAGAGMIFVLPRADGEAARQAVTGGLASWTPRQRERLLRRAAILLNSAWLSAVHRARRGPLSLSGGNLPLGRRDVEELPFPACLAGEAATSPTSALAAAPRRGATRTIPHAGRLLERPDGPLPDDPPALLALLDRAASVLLGSASGSNPEWDRIAQRAIFRLAGLADADAARILREWEAREGRRRERGSQRGRNNPSPTAKTAAKTAS